MTKNPKKEIILKSLSLFLKKGEVYEVRILGGRRILSGYFNDFERLAEEAAKHDGQAEGIYFTLNPVNPVLIARANNRVVPAKHTTADSDVKVRLVTLIDFDPERPSGMSSTDEEHALALARARECEEYLRHYHGFGPGILADSGNGAHLLYLVDLPNDKETTTMLSRVLQFLSIRFTDETVKVDLTTFNASRICKLYGTTAAKGDNTPERPHRVSRIISDGDVQNVVTLDKIKKLASLCPSSQAHARRGGKQSFINVDEFIKKHGLEVGRIAAWNDGMKWVLRTCPFNAEHTDSAAYIVQFASGAIAAGCHHDGCAGKTWKDLRQKLEGESYSESHRDTAPGLRREYVQTERGIAYIKPTHNGPVAEPLTNFTAQIITEIVENDGVEVNKKFEIEAKLGDHTVRFTISGQQFISMTWALEKLGARAIVYAGPSIRDHARVAIQSLSGPIPVRSVFTHTGWHRIADIEVFLHSGGAIGPEGPMSGVEVNLTQPEALSRVELPCPCGDLNPFIAASLRVLDVAPDHISFPLYAAIWRAPLGRVDFALHLVGVTGAGKTEIAALIQQHFGASLDSRHLPGSWLSTDNALEALTSAAKDIPLVIDDFAPSGNSAEVTAWYRKFARIIRGQGNAAGRQRMRPDTTLRPDKRSRCLPVSTGEEIPRGHSILVRMLVCEIDHPDQVNWDAITICQQHAREGDFARATAAYVQWLAGKLAEGPLSIKDRVQSYRDRAAVAGQHKRTPYIVAELAVGLEMFLDFAFASGAMDMEMRDRLMERAWAALLHAASAQQKLQANQDPVERFLEIIDGAIASGLAYLEDVSGNEIPGVHRIGWKDSKHAFLEPQVSFAFAQKLAREQNEPIPMNEKTLWKRLKARGLIARTDSHRNQYTWRNRRVICLEIKALSSASLPPEEKIKAAFDF